MRSRPAHRSWFFAGNSFFARSFAARSGWLAVAACAALLASAAPAAAAPHAFRNGQLTIQLFDFDPVQVPPTAPLASGVLEATRTETGITSLGLPSKVFSTSGLSISITDPGAEPIDGLLLTVFNPAGTFAAGGGSEGGFGGKVPLGGTAKVCLFGNNQGCTAPFATLSLPLSVVGQTKTVILDVQQGSPISVTVKGAPWTTGTIMVPNNKGGFATITGGIEDLGDGYLGVELVTPIYISTTFSGSAVVPAWGVLALEVPEPDVLALGLGGVGALALVGLRRRQRD